jgi:hypothetical protein
LHSPCLFASRSALKMCTRLARLALVSHSTCTAMLLHSSLLLRLTHQFAVQSSMPLLETIPPLITGCKSSPKGGSPWLGPAAGGWWHNTTLPHRINTRAGAATDIACDAGALAI